MNLLKKFGYIGLASVMTLSLVACSGEKKADESNKGTTTATDSQTTTQSTGVVKVGLGKFVSLESTKPYSEKDGLAQADNTIVAASFDKDGKIVDVKIDVAQNKVPVKQDGSVEAVSEFKTKMELGPDYAMKPASKIGKEWNEQAEALQKYFVGKTVDEIKGLKLEENKLTDADITSSVTIKVSDYILALEDAWKNAVEVSGVEKISLGIKSSSEKNKNAADGKGANVQIDTVYALVATDKDAKITKVVLDTIQNKFEFNEDGTLATDLTVNTKSKKELGDEYNMKPASKIGKEWFEQAASLEEYLVGKTVDDVKGLAIDEENHLTDEDIKSSVTIKVNSYQEVVVNALEK